MALSEMNADIETINDSHFHPKFKIKKNSNKNTPELKSRHQGPFQDFGTDEMMDIGKIDRMIRLPRIFYEGF